MSRWESQSSRWENETIPLSSVRLDLLHKLIVMKKIFVIISMILVSVPMAISGNEIYNGTYDNGTPSNEKDKLVSLSARFLNDKIYFKLSMLNESIGGVYTLMREFPDGTVELVEYKTITTNTINSPLLYCFVENKIPTTDCTYVIYRRSVKNERIAQWQFCSELNELCPEVVF